ncbi:MAG: hypothetical protein IPK83_03795 [Planctomycetes bacterium]|nr:hypothetical protein [Planctomycetota bacterium]
MLGLGGLVGGSELFLRGSVAIARSLGVTETVIGLTLVAIGTSMPELVTSVVAALRKQPDIALGNVIGSNVFNIGAILGISGIIRPIPFEPDMRLIHVPVLVGTSIILWLFIATGLTVSRREGMVLLVGLAAYLGWMIQHAM